MLMRRYRSSRSTLTLCLEVLEDRSLPSVSGLGAVLVNADLPGLGHLAERASHGLDNGIGSIVSSLVHSGIIGPALAEQIHTDLGRGNGPPAPPDAGSSSNPGDAGSSSAQNSGASSNSSSSSASATISTSGPSSPSSASQGATYSASLSLTSVVTSSSAVPANSVSVTLQEGSPNAPSAQTASSYSSSLSAGTVQPVSSSLSSSAAVEPAAPAATSRSAGQAPPPELSKTATTDVMPAAPMATPGPPPAALPVEAATTGPAAASPVAAFGNVPLADGPLAIATPQATLPAVAGVEVITTVPGPQEREETNNLAPQGSDDPADLAPVATVEEPDVLANFFANLYELADSGRMRKTLPWTAAGLLTAAACEIARRQLWQRRRELPLDGAVANALPDDPAGPPPGEEP